MKQVEYYKNGNRTLRIKYEGIKKLLEKKDKEIERLNNIINELEKDLIEYFKKEYPDRKLEDYNLENCTYDYALVILGRLQELKRK